MSNTKNTAAKTDTKPAAELTECPKCWGSGRFDCWKHVHGGVCFTCGGTGKVTARVWGFYMMHAGR
jgi:DnaJ-class molecular chaperone